MKVHRRLSTTIGGSVGAVDDFLDDAAPHKHFSMNYQAGSSPQVFAQQSKARTQIVSTQSAKCIAHARPAHAPIYAAAAP
jgi:hypothetical protein